MRRQTLVLGILALILIGAILTAGCAARERRGAGINPAPSAIRTPTPPARPTTTPALPGTATCTDEGGSTCSIGTDCPAAWDDAADTFSCCQEPCSNAGGDAIITIDPYETEVMDSDLGDIL